MPPFLEWGNQSNNRDIDCPEPFFSRPHRGFGQISSTQEPSNSVSRNLSTSAEALSVQSRLTTSWPVWPQTRELIFLISPLYVSCIITKLDSSQFLVPIPFGILPPHLRSCPISQIPIVKFWAALSLSPAQYVPIPCRKPGQGVGFLIYSSSLGWRQLMDANGNRDSATNCWRLDLGIWRDHGSFQVVTHQSYRMGAGKWKKSWLWHSRTDTKSGQGRGGQQYRATDPQLQAAWMVGPWGDHWQRWGISVRST